LELLADAPEVARRMASTAQRVGVGPMAAVAGAMAQCAAEAGLAAGAKEVIVENGGDIYLKTTGPVTIGLHAGTSKIGDRLAFALQVDETPLAVCSSSGTMGHSMRTQPPRRRAIGCGRSTTSIPPWNSLPASKASTVR
jgi:ApbE superfamily uncharacterized protein (UPF0280 family)